MSTTPKAPYPQKNLSQDLKGFDQPSWKKAPPFTNSISGPLSRYPSSSPENPSQGGTVLGKRFNPEESNSDSSNKSARKTGSGLVDYFARRQASSDKVQNLTRDKSTSNDPFCDTSDDDPFFISHPPKLPVYPNFSKSTTDSSFNYVSKPDWSPPHFFTSASPTSLEHLETIQKLTKDKADLMSKVQTSEKEIQNLKREIDMEKDVVRRFEKDTVELKDAGRKKDEKIKELENELKRKAVELENEKEKKFKFSFDIEVKINGEKVEGVMMSGGK